MQIGCTQKLLAYLKREPEAVEEGRDAFYSWSATLLTIRRRKTIAVVHDASRCGFVLYGVTAKQLKQMDQLLIEGIRRMLEAEGVVPEVVQEYLQGCGLAIRYTKTQNRSAVALLNQFTRRVEQFAEGFDGEELFQPPYSPAVEQLCPFCGKGTFSYPGAAAGRICSSLSQPNGIPVSYGNAGCSAPFTFALLPPHSGSAAAVAV